MGMMGKLQETREKVEATRARLDTVTIKESGGDRLVEVLIIAGLLIIGSWLVIENQLNLGQFVAAEIVIILLISSVEKLVLSVETIYDVLTGLEKIGFITDLPLEETSKDTMDDPQRQNEIRFEKFSLHFPGSARPELNKLNITLSPGEWTWIKGGDNQLRNALIRSVAGDYHQFDGRLTVGGLSVRNWDQHDLRSRIAIYRDSDDIIDGTLLENVTLHSGPIPLSRVISIAEMLGLNDYVEEVEGGWEKDAGTDGMYLPDWVKPRVILCRILLGSHNIFLLSCSFGQVEKEVRESFLNFVQKSFPKAVLVAMEDVEPHSGEFKQILRFERQSIIPDKPTLNP